MRPELIWHFDIQLAKNTQLSLSGPNVKAHEVRTYKYLICIDKGNMCTKYEVSIFNPVARRSVHKTSTTPTMHDEQSMIVQGPWLINQVSQKLLSMCVI